MAVNQALLDYVRTLEDKYGSVLYAKPEEIKILNSFLPEESAPPRKVKHYKKGERYEELKQRAKEMQKKKYPAKIRVSGDGVDTERLRDIIEDNGMTINKINELIGYQLDDFINFGKSVPLEKLETLCELMEIDILDVLYCGEPTDRNITLPNEWINYEAAEAIANQYSHQGFKLKFQMSKQSKFNQRTRFTLEQVKKLGDPKEIMTKEGYVKLEEIIGGFREI